MESTIDLASCLADIPDRRRAEGKMYGQVGVILFSIIAMLSGARSYRQIHTLIDRRLGSSMQLSRRQRCGGRRPTRRCAASCNGSIRPNWSGRSDAMRKGSINPAPPLRRGSSRSTGRRCGRASTPLRTARRRTSSARSRSTIRSSSPTRSSTRSRTKSRPCRP